MVQTPLNPLFSAITAICFRSPSLTFTVMPPGTCLKSGKSNFGLKIDICERLVISHFNTFTKGSVLQAGPFLFTGVQSYIISISRPKPSLRFRPPYRLVSSHLGSLCIKSGKMLTQYNRARIWAPFRLINTSKYLFLCQINLSSTRFKKKDVSFCGRRPLSIGDVFTVTGRQSA